MARGVLYVETYPASPETAAEYHKWYNEVHIPEIASVDGIVSARRFGPVGEDGPFIAIYEIDSDDDVASVRDRLAQASQAGGMSPPVGVRMDPPPVMRWYEEIHSYKA